MEAAEEMNGEDGENEEYDEEIILMVELPSLSESIAGRHCSILGLDSPAPVLQIGSATFQGKYEHAVGTSLLFSESESDGNLKFQCQCDKKLVMKRVIIRDKTAAANQLEGPATTGDLSTSETKPTSSDRPEGDTLPTSDERSVTSASSDKLEGDFTLPTSDEISDASTASDKLGDRISPPKADDAPAVNEKPVCSLEVELAHAAKTSNT